MQTAGIAAAHQCHHPLSRGGGVKAFFFYFYFWEFTPPAFSIHNKPRKKLPSSK
jgi:hypothetical protein